MSSRLRTPYKIATEISQQLLDACADNLTNQIELIVEIEAPDSSIIRASDRNKYVGEHFYQALTNFPDVSRTIGEFLGQGIVFSEMTFELSNADGRFNKFLPTGNSFGGWIGRLVTVKIGLKDIESSYVQIFKGSITEEGGFSRTVKSIIIKARDILEKINISFPTAVFSQSSYPKAVDDLWNTIIPVIYGDWTVNVLPNLASVPAKVINGGDIYVTGTDLSVTVTLSPDINTPVIFTAVNHRLEINRAIHINSDNPNFPNELLGTHYIKSVTPNEFTIGPENSSGAHVLLTGDVTGNHTAKKPDQVQNTNVACVISANSNSVLDTNNIFIRRSEIYYKIPSSLIENVNANKNYFEIIHNDASIKIGGENWVYQTSDEIFVKVKGKDLGVYSENIVSISKDILETYGNVSISEFDSSWDYFKNKSSPAQSAIYDIKGRAYIFEQQNVMEYSISLLEQVRLELFINMNQKIDLSSFHWEEFVSNPDFVVHNWDLEKDSLVPQIDDRNNFNRARAVYSYLPDLNDNAFSTRYFRNQASINQVGRDITKLLVYPNLHITSQVEDQCKETLKLASGYREIISCSLTNRAILKDIGDWILMDVEIGSTNLIGIPCQIREISYSSSGLKLAVRLWSFAMLPFGTWNPSYSGIVGGQNASILAE
jgi:hypothetical protein